MPLADEDNDVVWSHLIDLDNVPHSDDQDFDGPHALGAWNDGGSCNLTED